VCDLETSRICAPYIYIYIYIYDISSLRVKNRDFYLRLSFVTVGLCEGQRIVKIWHMLVLKVPYILIKSGICVAFQEFRNHSVLMWTRAGS